MRDRKMHSPHSLYGERRFLLDRIPPIALGVLAYSGQLAASPILSWMPMNATYICVGIVAITSVYGFLVKRSSLLFLLPIGLWVLFLFPALVPNGGYGQEKFASLMSISLLCSTAPFWILREYKQRVTFLATVAVAAILSGLIALFTGEAAAAASGLSDDVLILEGSNTIGTARLVGAGALVLLAFALTMRGADNRPRQGLRLTFLLTSFVLFGVMMATGSRGPFAGMALGTAALLLVSPIMLRRRLRGFLVLGVAGLAASFWAISRDYALSGRSFGWITGERDTSTAARQYMWEIASDYVLLHPVGLGWGGFSTLPNVPATINYPHNLFLELYVETGWLIGSLAVLFIGVSVWRLMLYATDPTGAALFTLAVFALTNAMVSGDINDNRLMWIVLSCAWIVPSHMKHRGERPDEFCQKHSASVRTA